MREKEGKRVRERKGGREGEREREGREGEKVRKRKGGREGEREGE